MSEQTMSIQLNDVQFYAYHGLYKEEQKLGNQFIVNLQIDFIPQVDKIKSIEETIDYVQVYDLVKARMQQATPLLETVVGDIADAILDLYPMANKVYIHIAKAKVYINTLEGNMAVSLTKSR